MEVKRGNYNHFGKSGTTTKQMLKNVKNDDFVIRFATEKLTNMLNMIKKQSRRT